MGDRDIYINQSESESEADAKIPVDYFVTKDNINNKNKGLDAKRQLRFVDSSGNIVYTVNKTSSSASPGSVKTRLLLDASGNLLISLRRINSGSWQGFMRDANGEEDLIFRSERIQDTFNKTEFDLFLVHENCEQSRPDLKIKGRPFYRACTIYKGNSIVAQTSLMHKLWDAYVPRNKFRLTIFPGLVNRALVVALIVIYFDGRKIWL
ncbi:hypothetical protein DCAR_0727470 [Daucus carota subsp. sativus]|uniref:Uncharacterized protein n=1 Tax=Daucus carota subsp. sativus TaxID=79200 RepID=A0A161Y3R5_DAUCS|nr:PREDICTED: protein LURP-one-related 7 [Daucus carota subsp. sativus]WOH08034.1 hypothetical protein DCAR_0727470 [Daucus carota subsp. sativus]